jgi:hypothetical protein
MDHDLAEFAVRHPQYNVESCHNSGATMRMVTICGIALAWRKLQDEGRAFSGVSGT